jgi:hypothetical protein
LRKRCPYKSKKSLGLQTDKNESRTSPTSFNVKTLNIENKDRILKATREKSKLPRKANPSR